jgi:hypothetical protein
VCGAIGIRRVTSCQPPPSTWCAARTLSCQPTMSAMHSTDTFDLGCFLAENDNCSPLLQVSFSLHSLPTVSSFDDIPPFPAHSLAHKVHVDTYLSLHQLNHLRSCSTTAGDRTNAGIGVLLAAPTAPRLRSMMTETLHIKKWLVRYDTTKSSMP